MSTWCNSAVNRASLSFRAAWRTRSSPLDTPCPALSPGCVALPVFPLARPLSSGASAAGCPALFGAFAGSTGLSDSPRLCISGFGRWPSLSVPPLIGWSGSRGVSRFSRMEVPYVLRFFDRAGSAGDSRIAPSAMLPSAGPTASAPRICLFRGSIARPVRTPVNASLRPCGSPTHHSGPPWVATPSV